MKTIIKKITAAIVIAMITSANLVAFEDSLKVNNGNSIDLVINDVNKTTTIAIKDERGNTLFEQKIDKSEKFAKSFNFELLANGEYTIEIEDDTRARIFPVNITNDLVSVNNSKTDEYFKPIVNQKGSKVYISQFSPECKPLYVAIYNSNNEVIHEEILRGKMDLGKIFDFSNSFTGQYRIYMESKGMSYDHLVYMGK